MASRSTTIWSACLDRQARAQLEQAGLDLVRIVRQFVAAGPFVVGQLEPIERGRRRQGRAAVVGEQTILAERIAFVANDGQQRVAAQLVVIIEVLVPQRQPGEALRQELGELVIHKTRVALIVETLGQCARHAQAVIDLTQQQRAAVGGEGAARKISNHLARTEGLKEPWLVLTVCRRRSGVAHFHWAQLIQPFGRTHRFFG